MEPIEERVLASALFRMLESGTGIITQIDEGKFVVYKTEDLLKCVPADSIVENIKEEDVGKIITFTEIPELLI